MSKILRDIIKPINVPNTTRRRTTTASTENALLPIFRSSASTEERRTVVNRKAKMSISITSDINGQIMDKNHMPIKEMITL